MLLTLPFFNWTLNASIKLPLRLLLFMLLVVGLLGGWHRWIEFVFRPMMVRVMMVETVRFTAKLHGSLLE